MHGKYALSHGNILQRRVKTHLTHNMSGGAQGIDEEEDARDLYGRCQRGIC